MQHQIRKENSMTVTAALVPGISAAEDHYMQQGAREFLPIRGTRCTWRSPSTATSPRLSRRGTRRAAAVLPVRPRCRAMAVPGR